MLKSLILAAFTSSCSPAMAETCLERDEMVTQLFDKYGETHQTMALTDNGAVVETWANTKKNTWTVIITKPNGVSCVAAVGSFFKYIGDKPPVSNL